ncbi:uncharacterized protein LOC129749507 [Uranotaenia lowii]|uniref:uncharacterized protein LOC129749507 n=1 Tax=Uranotaenia lowii TaxID=190385 RepID=UPI00247B12B4|nr:uncharacterized protein LOC129749507 [Uranotaenia lowii]
MRILMLLLTFLAMAAFELGAGADASANFARLRRIIKPEIVKRHASYYKFSPEAEARAADDAGASPNTARVPRFVKPEIVKRYVAPETERHYKVLFIKAPSASASSA